MKKILLASRLPLFLFGAILFFINERYLFAKEVVYPFILAISLLSVFLSAGISLYFSIAQKKLKQESKSWLLITTWQGSIIIGLLLYLAFKKITGDLGVVNTLPQKSLLTSWLLFIILGSFAGIGLEFSHKSSGTGLLADLHRVKRSGAIWLIIGLLFSSLVCYNYVIVKKDKTFDLSYLKASRPSTSTLNILNNFKKPIDIVLFYPKNNDVKPFIEEYFFALSQKSDKIKLNTFDVELTPTKAEKYRVSKNGQIIFMVDKKTERINTGLSIKSARTTLRKLDTKVRKTLLTLLDFRKTIYFTTGHGEMAWTGFVKNGFKSIRNMERFLRDQNYTLKLFGVTQGSTDAVPEDAACVVIAGPSSAFLQEEIPPLKKYLTKNGGRLLILLDVTKASNENTSKFYNIDDDPLIKFLSSTGVYFHNKILANEANHITFKHSSIDNWFIYTNKYTSHESVTILSKNDKLPLFLFQTGYLEFTPKLGLWKNDQTVRTLPSTFADINKNMHFDKGKETQKSYTIAVASNYNPEPKKSSLQSPKKGKIITIADANIISDNLFNNRTVPNILFIANSLKWLLERSFFTEDVSTEEDLPIIHTKDQDSIWFNITVFIVPLFILLIGFFIKRKPAKKEKKNET